MTYSAVSIVGLGTGLSFVYGNASDDLFTQVGFKVLLILGTYYARFDLGKIPGFTLLVLQ